MKAKAKALEELIELEQLAAAVARIGGNAIQRHHAAAKRLKRPAADQTSRIEAEAARKAASDVMAKVRRVARLASRHVPELAAGWRFVRVDAAEPSMDVWPLVRDELAAAWLAAIDHAAAIHDEQPELVNAADVLRAAKAAIATGQHHAALLMAFELGAKLGRRCQADIAALAAVGQSSRGNMAKARDTNAEQKAQERTLRVSIIEEQRTLHKRLSQAIEAAADKIGEIEGYPIEPESLARWYRRTKGGHSI
jgi:hypothetical protein